MKRHLAAALSILAVVAAVGFQLAAHPDTSTSLGDVKLVPHSEHSQPVTGDKLAGIRIRLTPTDLDDVIRSNAKDVPSVALASAE
jgi:hypothetical protein